MTGRNADMTPIPDRRPTALREPHDPAAIGPRSRDRRRLGG
jgi:hypothetical protein